MIAEGKLEAVPDHLGNKESCSFCKSWSCQGCTHGSDSDLILGCWDRAVALFAVRLWHLCVLRPLMGIEQCEIEALTGSSSYETQHTWL